MKKFRTILLYFVILLLFGIIETKLYHLQVTQREYYIEKAHALGEMKERLALRRGQIFITDRNSNKIPASTDKDYPIIYAVPKEIEDPEEIAFSLASLIDWEEEELIGVIDNPDSLFRLLVDKASEEVLAEVEERDLQGIHIDKKKHRFYPFEELASHALGFVGINKEYNIPRGLYGIEKEYNADLSTGENLELTIDRNIQAQSERILKELMENFSADGGTIIVQEPQTGKILALANAPNFDPNTYSKFPIASFLNPAVQNIYEAGSVFKPITMAAGIDTGSITPETTYEDRGSITINGEEIKNWDEKANGVITMTNVIEGSVNTGAVFAMQKTGKKDFLSYLKKFGFGKITEVDLPDEVGGSLENLERKHNQDIDFAAASFGQGTAVTPIQLIGAFSSIANGGKLMRPYLNTDKKPNVIRRVIDKETSRKVTEMMESAVEKAWVAALPQYKIAGKTGTAQIADLTRGGYTDEFNHTYIGFGPTSNPRFTALIKLVKPSAELAGRTVVPAFRELAQFILSYYNVPPDKISE
ncbi:hypothetical protein CL629_04085 [bacterium]|nr:hypothetical protein [bacterium]|tara:strand:- start:1363 stop:2955 length:1593 start_codon:yes stop_codon:yes gene_type:complete